MAKITMKDPDGPYSCELDTGAMEVQLREVFLGATFVTAAGEKLSVSMRDDGFEVRYSGDKGETGFNAGWVDFKNGIIERKSDGSTERV